MYKENSINPPSEEEVSLKDIILKTQGLINYVFRKWKLLFLIGVLGGACGATYGYLTKPTYTANLSFVVEEDKSGGIGSAAGLASQFGFDVGGSGSSAFSGDNLIELLKSRSMVEKTLLTNVLVNSKMETLAELYIEINKLRNTWKADTSLRRISYNAIQPRKDFTLKQDSILGQFYRQILNSYLTVEKVDKKLSIITVKVVSKNQLFSKFFTENLVRNVSDFYIQTKTEKESENVAILQHQADSVRRQLNGAISGVAISQDFHPDANPNLQSLRIPTQKRQFDVQANTAILSELVRNLEISKVTLRKETPLIQIIDAPILPLDKTQLGRIRGFITGFLISTLLGVIYLILRLVYKRILA